MRDDDNEIDDTTAAAVLTVVLPALPGQELAAPGVMYRFEQ